MSTKNKQEAQSPLILRCHRLMEAFAKSDEERDFYIDRPEGFLVYVDLDKPQTELDALEEELKEHPDRYCLIPKLSFYETKKIMEGFVNEKVYDIDTKEKLLDIIQSKEARENFLEFIHDHHSEQEKWQQFYQERSRIRIIEWLRLNHFHFVFEEDLDLPRQIIEKLKQTLFQTKVGKEIQNARKLLVNKAKTYYSTEALNPRPKRGRPPKQAIKPDVEPQIASDIYTTIPPVVLPYLFTPDSSSSSSSIFSSKFETEADDIVHRYQLGTTETSLNQKLSSLRALSTHWLDKESPPMQPPMTEPPSSKKEGASQEGNLSNKPNALSPPTKKEPKKQETKVSRSPPPKPKKEVVKNLKPTKSKAKRIMPQLNAEKKTIRGKPPLKKLFPPKR